MHAARHTNVVGVATADCDDDCQAEDVPRKQIGRMTTKLADVHPNGTDNIKTFNLVITCRLRDYRGMHPYINYYTANVQAADDVLSSNSDGSSPVPTLETY